MHQRSLIIKRNQKADGTTVSNLLELEPPKGPLAAHPTWEHGKCVE